MINVSLNCIDTPLAPVPPVPPSAAWPPPWLAAPAAEFPPSEPPTVAVSPADATAPSEPEDSPADFVTWEDSIPIESVSPCPRCGSYELWQSIAGTWRCMVCGPDAAAYRRSQRLREQAARQRRLSPPPEKAEADAKPLHPHLEGCENG
jgi:hypothetical protein